MTKQNKSRLLEFCCIAVLSFLLLLFFSTSTSPLYSSFGYDSIEYKLAGSAMLDGLVIYRDIFHQKGAAYFFIEAIGELLCRIVGSERWGTFLLQYVNAILVIFIAKKTADLFFDKTEKNRKLYAWSIVMSSVFFWMTFFNGGNLVEEFSMLYEFVTVYIAVRYCVYADRQKENSCTFKPIYGFILGICFAVTFWSKPTTAVFIGASILVIGIHMLANKKSSLFWKCIAFGVFGIAVVTVPLLLYYYFNNALSDMINQCFLFNMNYIESENSDATSILILLKDIAFVYAFPILMLLLAFILHFNLLSTLCLVTSVATMAMFLLTSTQYMCYHQVQVPIVFVFLLAFSTLNISKRRVKSFALTGLVVFTMIFSVGMYMRTYLMTDQNHYWQQVTEKVDNFKIGTEDIFAKDTSNNDILYVEENDYKISRYFYYHMKKYPFSANFCVPFFERCNTSEYLDEFYYDFENAPPKYIVMANDRESLNAAFDEVIKKAEGEYKVVYTDDVYSLYELKN